MGRSRLERGVMHGQIGETFKVGVYNDSYYLRVRYAVPGGKRYQRTIEDLLNISASWSLASSMVLSATLCMIWHGRQRGLSESGVAAVIERKGKEHTSHKKQTRSKSPVRTPRH
jgi:hypothetical protein